MNQLQAKSLENAWKGIHFLKHFSHLVCNFTEETYCLEVLFMYKVFFEVLLYTLNLHNFLSRRCFLLKMNYLTGIFRNLAKI